MITVKTNKIIWALFVLHICWHWHKIQLIYLLYK